MIVNGNQIGDTMKSRFAFFAAVTLMPVATTSANVLYDNTIPSGPASGFCDGCVSVDDVLVPVARDPSALPLAITEITVGTLGFGNTALSIYSFPVAPDGAPAPNPALIDSMTVDLTGAVQPVTFGNGSTTLFTVKPNFTAQPGFGLLYIGFSGNADWVWANGPDANLPTAYLYHQDTGAIFLNTSPGPPFPPNVSYYLTLDGAPVPEPVSGAILGMAVLVLFGLRRKQQIELPMLPHTSG